MSGKWQRTFEVSVPVERVWRAFTEEGAELREQPPGATPDPNRGVQPKMLEVQTLKLLRWAEEGGQLLERAEFTVTFESTDRGSRFTVTRCGFGEGEVTDVFSESTSLGWEQGFMDMVLYLETGQRVLRHYYGCLKSTTGVTWATRDWGLEVLDVGRETFGAEAGLTRGDRLVRLGGVPIFGRQDVWLLLQEHDVGRELDVEYIRGRERRHGRGRLSPYERRPLSGE
jgi:uncharacterized protein YndB with AHSA1/START domain